jgi:hypothetical protein
MNEIDLKLLKEEGNLRGFVDPFVNVFKVAKTATKGIANSATTFLRLLNPFLLSPQKIDKILSNYDNRAASIKSELSGLNQTIKSSLGPDAAVIAFLAAPAAFVTLTATKAARSTSSEILLDSTGLSPWLSNTLGLYWDKFKDAAIEDELKSKRDSERSERDSRRSKEYKRELLATQGPLGDLMRIFFFAHHARTGNSLNENAESIGKQEFYNRISKEMKDIGVYKKTNPIFAEFQQAKTEQINEFLTLAKKYKIISEAITNSENFEEFVKKIDDQEILKAINIFYKKNEKSSPQIFEFLKKNFKPSDELIKKTSNKILEDIPPKEVLEKLPKNSSVNFLLTVYEKISPFTE